jgi:tRNA-dihydrouridine synthase A
MLDWSDRHCRYFHRLISKHAVLYTEMITTGALRFGDKERYLNYDEAEHPVALQLGGSDPVDLAECAEMAEVYGYDEVNLNVGCPSDRVQNGRFGACLMAEPDVVADCVAAMRNKVAIPITVKTRIGIDNQDSYSELSRFVEIEQAAGCKVFIVHARKAWLQGLSPKQNRELPPLRYDVVYQLKQDFPKLEFILNGGIKTIADAQNHLRHVDGVMIGREVYQNPYFLAEADKLFFDFGSIKPDRIQLVRMLIPYIQRQISAGVRLNSVSRHILGLFHGQPGAKGWRRYISENAHKSGANEEVIIKALEFVEG